jgi:hypothetical protein
MIFETRYSGSGSQLSKLAERMLGAALCHANMVPSAPMCLFPNVVVNNEADLWIITRLAPANGALFAISASSSTDHPSSGGTLLWQLLNPVSN